MDKTKIEWCDASWNPITGCLHGCEYCYARKIANRFGWHAIEPDIKERVLFEKPISKGKVVPYLFDFAPTFHKYRLADPQKWKKPRNIFVCSMADLFGDWVPDEWIEQVFKACEAAPQHNYLFLTKNPQGYKRIPLWLDNNIWLGTTVNNTADIGDRGFFLWEAKNDMTDNIKTFLSIEPLMEPLCPGPEYPGLQNLQYFNWIIIGAETGNRKDKIIPKKEWIDDIVQTCRYYEIPVFMKNSLIPIVGEENMLREFPEGLKL